MKNKVYHDFDSAVADMKDGMTFMSPGFGNVGLARNLLAAVHRLGVKDLTGISNNAGSLDDRVDVGTLIEAGQVKKMICAFTAPTHPSQITPFVQMYNDDLLDAELVPQGTLAERMRAAAAGIGAFYTPASVGTELAEGKEHREINGRTYVLEYPCRLISRSSAPIAPTPSATCNSASPSATSTPSWPWPPTSPSLRSRTASLNRERSTPIAFTSPACTLTAWSRFPTTACGTD